MPVTVEDGFKIPTAYSKMDPQTYLLLMSAGHLTSNYLKTQVCS